MATLALKMILPCPALPLPPGLTTQLALARRPYQRACHYVPRWRCGPRCVAHSTSLHTGSVHLGTTCMCSLLPLLMLSPHVHAHIVRSQGVHGAATVQHPALPHSTSTTRCQPGSVCPCPAQNQRSRHRRPCPMMPMLAVLSLPESHACAVSQTVNEGAGLHASSAQYHLPTSCTDLHMVI